MDMKKQRNIAILVATLFAALCVLIAVKGDILTLRYVASTSGDKYHKPSCEYAERIKEENRIYYGSTKKAEDDGKRPCSMCITD